MLIDFLCNVIKFFVEFIGNIPKILFIIFVPASLRKKYWTWKRNAAIERKQRTTSADSRRTI